MIFSPVREFIFFADPLILKASYHFCRRLGVRLFLQCPHHKSPECGRWLMFIKETGCVLSSVISIDVICAEPHHVFFGRFHHVPSPFWPILYHFLGSAKLKNLSLGKASIIS